jgi:hypothetical protein
MPRRRPSQLVSPLGRPRESYLMRPQRIAILLMLKPCHSSNRKRGLTQPAVEHEWAGVDSLELQSHGLHRHLGLTAIPSDRARASGYAPAHRFPCDPTTSRTLTTSSPIPS